MKILRKFLNLMIIINFAGFSSLNAVIETIGEAKTVDNLPIFSDMSEVFESVLPWQILFLPVLAILFAWYKKEKAKSDNPIIPKYSLPEKIHVSLVGTVIDGEFNSSDFLAGIIDLVVNKCVEIDFRVQKSVYGENKEYFLKKIPLKANSHGAKALKASPMRKYFYEKLLGKVGHLYTKEQRQKSMKMDETLKKILKISPDNDFQEFDGVFLKQDKLEATYKKIKREIDKKDIFSSGVQTANSAYKMYKTLSERREKSSFLYYFSEDLSLVKKFNKVYSIIVFLLIFLFLPPNIKMFFLNYFLVLGLFVGGFIWASRIYPKLNSKGFKLRHEAQCYREFLETAEVDQLTLKQQKVLFEKNLPYAIAFGATNKWASHFSNLSQNYFQWLPLELSLDNFLDKLNFQQKNEKL